MADRTGSDAHAPVEAQIEALIEGVLTTPGDSTTVQRRAAFEGEVDTGPVGVYLAKVADASFRVTGDDLQAVRGEGLSEDAILELTLAAALGAAWRHFQRGVALLEPQ